MTETGTWIVLFDAASKPPDLGLAWFFAGFGLIWFLLSREIGRLPGRRPVRITGPFVAVACAVAAVGIAAAPAIRHLLYPNEAEAISSTPVVEGPVTDLVFTGKSEIFHVSGVQFIVAPSVATQGLNQMGLIGSGDYVRVHYVEGRTMPTIVRLEVRR